MQTKMEVWMGGFALIAMASISGCQSAPAAKPAPPVKSVATLEEVMHNMIIPSAEIVWKSVGTIATKEGVKEFAPQTDDEWFNIESAATVLTESGNLLMMEGRAKDSGHWIDRAKALRESGDGVRQAAKKHDKDLLFERGGYLFDACQGCHFEYRFEKDPKVIRTH